MVKVKRDLNKTSSKSHFMAVYDGAHSTHWNGNQPLSQKSINTNGPINLKERPGSNKKHTPSKKHVPKTSGKCFVPNQ